MVESKIDYTYDSQNRLTETITKVFDGKKWINVSKENILYNTGTTGINETILSVNLYPNPSTDYVIIETKSTSAANINVYSLSGQLVISIQSNNLSEEKIDVSVLQKGIYIIQVLQGADVYSSKLLVN